MSLEISGWAGIIASRVIIDHISGPPSTITQTAAGDAARLLWRYGHIHTDTVTITHRPVSASPGCGATAVFRQSWGMKRHSSREQERAEEAKWVEVKQHSPARPAGLSFLTVNKWRASSPRLLYRGPGCLTPSPRLLLLLLLPTRENIWRT